MCSPVLAFLTQINAFFFILTFILLFYEYQNITEQKFILSNRQLCMRFTYVYVHKVSSLAKIVGEQSWDS